MALVGEVVESLAGGALLKEVSLGEGIGFKGF